MPHETTPSTFWHYTDAHGLYGIVTSSLLRFGDANFLNDRTERVYGEKLLASVLAEEVANDASGATARAQHILGSRSWPDRLYVCSFSGTDESISQWQRYGADGAGYCIGFDPRKLDELFDEDGISRDVMLYDVDQQRQLIREAIHAGMRSLQRAEEKRRAGGGYMADALFADIDIEQAKLRLKNPYFHDEKEWRYFLRIIVEDDPDDDDEDLDAWTEHYSVRGAYVKPYLELPRAVPSASGKKLPIVRVICGPKLDGEFAAATTRRFLRTHGYRVPVESSALAEIWR